MAIAQYSINSSGWTPITSSGQNATAWLDEDGDGESGMVDIRIFHGESPPDASKLTMGKKIFKSNANNDMMVLIADSPTDIFYAIAKSGGAIVTVDAS